MPNQSSPPSASSPLKYFVKPPRPMPKGARKLASNGVFVAAQPLARS